MVKKVSLLVLVLMLISIGNLLAQEKEGYIKSTLNAGYIGTFYSNDVYSTSSSFTGLSVDVDFVNYFGLTFAIQGIMYYDWGVGAWTIVPIGIGYTYTANTWGVGVKVMGVTPAGTANGHIGFDLNGTFWVNNQLGLTGSFAYYYALNLGETNQSMINARGGISIKF